MLKIVTVPSNILNSPTKPVLKIDNKIILLVKEMGKTLKSQKDPEGVGLAAPQVGYDLSLFIIKPTKKSPIEVFINPKIIKQLKTNQLTSQPGNQATHKPSESEGKHKKHTTPLEGCLSIPRIWGPIRRSLKILLEYQTIDGRTKQKWFSGFKAVIIEHEIDHLNGILFTRRAIEQNSQLFEEKEGELKKLEY